MLELTVLKGLQHVSYFPLVLLNYLSSTRLRDFPGILTAMVLLFLCFSFSFNCFFQIQIYSYRIIVIRQTPIGKNTTAFLITCKDK